MPTDKTAHDFYRDYCQEHGYGLTFGDWIDAGSPGLPEGFRCPNNLGDGVLGAEEAEPE